MEPHDRMEGEGHRDLLAVEGHHDLLAVEGHHDRMEGEGHRDRMEEHHEPHDRLWDRREAQPALPVMLFQCTRGSSSMKQQYTNRS